MFISILCGKCNEQISAADVGDQYADSRASVIVPLSVHICKKPEGTIDKSTALSPFRFCPHGIWNGDCPEHDPLRQYAEQEGWKYKTIPPRTLTKEEFIRAIHA